MATVLKYRVWCNTSSKWEYVWLRIGSPTPTTCPVDPVGHTIDPAKTSIVEKVGGVAKVDDFGRLRTSAEIGVGSGVRLVSHNFCDKCTWWHRSILKQGMATTTSDQLAYDITGVSGAIDLRHGRLTGEDLVLPATVAPDGVTMTYVVPEVKVNGVVIPAVNEDALTGSDRYVIDYDLGIVTFAVARAPADTVTVSLMQSSTSEYSYKPSAGKRLVLTSAEIDFSEDADITSLFMTKVFGSHSVNTGGAKVVLATRIFKNMRDLHSSANKFYGPLPANIGGSGGVPVQIYTFEWAYSKSDILYDTPSYLDLNGYPAEYTWNEVEVEVGGHVPYPGSYLTIMYRGYEEDEAA